MAYACAHVQYYVIMITSDACAYGRARAPQMSRARVLLANRAVSTDEAWSCSALSGRWPPSMNALRRVSSACICCMQLQCYNADLRPELSKSRARARALALALHKHSPDDDNALTRPHDSLRTRVDCDLRCSSGMSKMVRSTLDPSWTNKARPSTARTRTRRPCER